MFLNLLSQLKEKHVMKMTDILTGYVSGWLGFYLYHELAYHDILCVILATLALSTHGSYKAIHVPTDMTMKLRNI